MILPLEDPQSNIMHLEAVDNLMKRRTDFKAQVYETCRKGCLLYNEDDTSTECSVCGNPRYNDAFAKKDTPRHSIKLLSIGDVLSKLLTNDSTRQELLYRSQH